MIEPTFSSTNGEVITLQFGRYSNHVGAHFWNSTIQEIFLKDFVNAGTLFRPSSSKITPRVIMFDMKGSLGSYQHEEEHENPSSSQPEQEEKSDVGTWKGAVEVHKSTSVLSDTDRYVDFHHKSVYELKELQYMVHDFDYFGLGHDIWRKESLKDDITDLLRYFAEECDALQGFQMFVDTCSGFSGFASDYLSYIRDEFPKVPVVTYSFQPPTTKFEKKNLAAITMNNALCLYNLSSQSNLYIPVTVDHLTTHSFPGLHINLQDDFESSFVFAQAIAALTTPHRILKYHCSMSSLTQSLWYSEHMNISALATSLPFPFDVTSPRLFDTFQEPLSHSRFLQYLVPVSHPKHGSLIVPEGEFSVLRGSGVIEPASFMPYLMKSQCDPRRQTGYLLPQALISDIPFHFTSRHIQSRTNDNINVTPQTTTAETQMSVMLHADVQCLSYLATTRMLHPYIDSVVKNFKQVNKKPFETEAESVDDMSEITNELEAIEDQYQL